MDLSVVIVNYNVRHFLEQCLHSVRKAAINISCEVFVVDNNSADGSCSMVASNFPEIILISNVNNPGFSTACNQAIRQSKGRFVLLLNPDTVVEEDTFTRCLAFMNSTPDAGAIGVKMIDGNGRLLPESKRAFPTLPTAFFKMAGFSRMFPKSRYFNRYYLGHLDNSKTTEADIIAGAFMFIRKEALDKTGLLDESFFMYGEDIDLSYRLIKAGYKNYYYPDVKIIHYKGQSTKKGEINHIIHFYRAMLIFTTKYPGKKGNKSFKLLTRIAIFFAGLGAMSKNLVWKYFLPISDTLIMSLVFIILIPLWGSIKFGDDYSFPPVFSYLLIPSFCIISLVSVFLAGGYKIPSRINNVLKGLLTAAAVILIIYSLLPLSLRFSRAVIVFGAFLVMLIILILRVLIAVSGIGIVENPFIKAVKVVVISNPEGYKGILNLLNGSDTKLEVAGRVSLEADDLSEEVLGNIRQIVEIIRINHIREIIISTRELPASEIISLMQILAGKNITIRISPAGEETLIGSKSLSFKQVIQPPGKIAE